MFKINYDYAATVLVDIVSGAVIVKFEHPFKETL